MAAKKPKRKKINLALQGGGSHGAFGWGVLDAFLEDGRLDIEGISATSAGAINAAAVAYGLTIGDRDKAREVLHDIWSRISEWGNWLSPIRRLPWEYVWPNASAYEEAVSFSLFETFTNAFSPYQFNPTNINPLRKVLEKTIEAEKIGACDSVKLFITATNVRTGAARVFENENVTIDAILASACLPDLFQAVEIDGHAYWDGGYTGNPALWPLYNGTTTRDICVVHINPIERPEIPKTPYDITNRMNEITFNAALLGEMRAIAFVRKLINEDWLKDEYKKKLKDIFIHAIRADEGLKEYSVASKFQTDWLFLTALRDVGRASAELWLKNHYDDIGVRPTVNIHEEYLRRVA